MRHGGEYFFEYKDIYCLFDNEKLSEVLNEMNMATNERITYFHALPGLYDVEGKIKKFLEMKYDEDEDAFWHKYYSSEYYDNEAQYILSYYLKGYAGKIRKACYGKYPSKNKGTSDTDDLYGMIRNINNDDRCSISLFYVKRKLLTTKVIYTGHIYFSVTDIRRLNGSLTNFFVEMMNGTVINFNSSYVDVFIENSEGVKEECEECEECED